MDSLQKMSAIFKTNNFILNKMNSHNSTERPINDKPRRSLTSEEAENLTGMVANRRALFESNKAPTHQTRSYTRPVSQQRPVSSRNTIDTSSKTISAYNVNRFINTRLTVDSCFAPEFPVSSSDSESSPDSNKENNTTIDTPTLLTNVNAYNSNHVGLPLWSSSEKTNDLMSIPVSVKQAKLCFESLATKSSKPTMHETPSSSNGRMAFQRISKFSEITHKKPPQDHQLPSDPNNIANLLSSSSASSSASSSISSRSSVKHSVFQALSVTSSESNSSREPTPRPIDTRTTKSSEVGSKSDTPNDPSMDLKFNQFKYRTNNIASRIKKLESKFQRNEPETSSFRSNQSSLVSASTSSNESFTNRGRHQSPKFLQLFQKQMDLPTRPDHAQDQFELNEPTMANPTKPILRKMTSTSSIGSSSSASSTTSSTNESIDLKIAEPDSPSTATVDSAPCVLPSFLRQSRAPIKQFKQPQPQVVAQHTTQLSSHLAKFVPKDSDETTEKVFSAKLENLSISKPFGSYQQQQQSANQTTTGTNRTTVVPKTTGRSSYTAGFVKNNAAMFNRTSDPTPASFKKTNRSAAATAREALTRWCRNRTVDYDNVSIDNFSSSWSNGLAFCALLHHFLPDAFDYDSLDAQNRRFNFELAFRIAEERADVVPLLDVDDMIEMGNSPDWKCVFTYVHSIYAKFKDQP